jgi:hypothetical protein
MSCGREAANSVRGGAYNMSSPTTDDRLRSFAKSICAYQDANIEIFKEERSGHGPILGFDTTSQISQQRDSAESLEQRMTALEAELREVRRIQLLLLQTLEEHFQRDLDRDGRVG